MESVALPDSSQRDGERTSLQGVGRAFDVLEAVADRPMTATDVSHALNIKWATAHRTLSYLLSRGYLERDEQTGTYHIGARAYSIGGAYLTDLPIVRMARAHLPNAVDESGATAQLVKRDGDRSVVLSVFEPRTNSLPETSVGYNFPLNCSSKGHVLLAYADDAVVDEFLAGPLPALTPYSITDPRKLRARLELVRRRGYAATARDTRLFSGSVSAPVHQADGRVVACVTLIVPAALVEQLMPRLIDTATRTAEAISLMLGWRPGMVHAGARAPERRAV